MTSETKVSLRGCRRGGRGERRTLSRLVLLLLAVLALAATPSFAIAQTAGGCDEESDDQGGGFRKIVGPGGEITYEYTGVIRVCGKVPKPNVVAILLEKTVEYEWENLQKEFLPKILNSVKKAPF